MHTSTRVIAAFAMLTLFGCGSTPRHEPKSPLSTPIPGTCESASSGTHLRLLTYNAMLSPGSRPSSTARVPMVAKALAEELNASSPPTVMCVQEVWFSHHREAILREIGLHEDDKGVVFEPRPGQGNVRWRHACSRRTLAPVRECVERRCADIAPEDTTSCAERKCLNTLLPLANRSSTCLECLISSAGLSLEGIDGRCVTGEATDRVYEGANGLLMIANVPLIDRETVRLPASYAERVALLATAELPDGERLRLACTEFSSNQPLGPTHPQFAGWAQEQAAQLSTVHEALQKTRAIPTAVIGELGFGTRSAVASETMTETVALADSLGYWSPAMHAEPPLCTACRTNSWQSPKAQEQLTSHILLRRADSSTLLPTCVGAALTGTLLRPEGPSTAHPSPAFGLRMNLVFASP